VNAVACLPPGNRPNRVEIETCREAWLRAELSTAKAILSLGRIAHESVRRTLGLRAADWPFSHGVEKSVDGRWLVSSYHPSPLNTRTGRLKRFDFIELVQRTLQMADAIQSG